MKLNFKKTLLTSALALFSLGACHQYKDGSTQVQTPAQRLASITMPAIPTSKTTGHTAEIIRALQVNKSLKDYFQGKKITFDENSYNAKTNSFDISNVKIIDDNNQVTCDRIVKNGLKSLQLVNVQSVHKFSIKKIIVMGDVTNVTNLDTGVAINDVNIIDVKNLDNTKISAITYMAKADAKGVENLNFNITGLDLSKAVLEKEKFIHSTKANISFYKRNKDSSDNNYTIKISGNMGLDINKVSSLRTTFNVLLDNKSIKNLLFISATANNTQEMTNSMNQLVESLSSTIKFNSLTANFINNGFLQAMQKANPSQQPSSKEVMKKQATTTLSSIMTAKEIDSWVQAMYNTVHNNKDFHLTIEAKNPVELTSVFTKIITNSSDNTTPQTQFATKISN